MSVIIDKEIVEEAVRYYSKDVQIMKCIEELSELMRAIIRYKRIGKKGLESLKEEIVDVYIMIEQLKIIADITQSDINKNIEYKLNRLKDRIQKDNI